VLSGSRPRRLGLRPDGKARRAPLLALGLVLAGVPLLAWAQGGVGVPGRPPDRRLQARDRGVVGGVHGEGRRGGLHEDPLGLLGRDESGNTLELTVDGPAAASGKLGGKVVTGWCWRPIRSA
jgi:hypothetical protein